MLYSYNSSNDKSQNVIDPKKWVCIWLSIQPEIFMNEINKKRIIEFRNNNILGKKQPFKLSIIYNSNLLNEHGTKDLDNFKKELFGINKQAYEQIDFIDLNSSQLRLEDELEKSLYAIADEEMKYIGSGGNPAAASDIIRLLKICRERGNYFDLDVCILRNQNYEESDDIAIKTQEKGLLHSKLNNDVIVTWPNQRSSEIKEIQEKIYKNHIITNNIIESQRFYIFQTIYDKFHHNESSSKEEIIDDKHYEFLAEIVDEIFSFLLKGDNKIFSTFEIMERDIPGIKESKYSVINYRQRIQIISLIINNTRIDLKSEKILNFALDHIYKSLVVHISGPGVFPKSQDFMLMENNFEEPTRNIFELIAFNQQGINKALYNYEKDIIVKMINQGLYSLDQPGEYSWGLKNK